MSFENDDDEADLGGGGGSKSNTPTLFPIETTSPTMEPAKSPFIIVTPEELSSDNTSEPNF